MEITKKSVAGIIDHTLLKPEATEAQIAKLCQEAIDYGFASVCVNPSFVAQAAIALKDSPVNVATVIGFPLGATSTASKAYETKVAIGDGADEVDMVISIGRAKEGNWDYVKKDIRAVVDAAAPTKTLVKVIIETCLLTDEEKVKACQMAKEAGADFVKTSTGFSTYGAKPEDVALMRKTVGPDMGVKASGGIHTAEEAVACINAGANRLGISAGIAVINGIQE
jgi:deoxyribose-phosphate aldolase